MNIDPLSLLTPRRRIVGMAAVLLPFLDDQGTVDWSGFERLLSQTFDAGLIPAVNMDTGFANLIDDDTKRRVLEITRRLANGRTFLGGAFVKDAPSETFNADGYRRSMESVQSFGGTPIVFPSYGMQSLDSAGLVNAFEQFARWSPRFYGFELGEAFVPFGRIFTIDQFAKIMDVTECVGAKHSSLRRTLEWERLALRNKQRPEFQILTGNDFAIDMVTFGSDYLLGLAAFAPELFALRDTFWKDGDPHFFGLNDALQYLGAFAFRSPTPAYRHSAAMFLKLTGRIVCDATHPQSPKRPDSDRPILERIIERLREFQPNRGAQSGV
jgi:dihydrodipicolinate synthase/N-acetylneuraminate lyase